MEMFLTLNVSKRCNNENYRLAIKPFTKIYIEREAEIDRYQQRASIDSISTFSEKMNKTCKKNDFPNF